MSEARHHDEPGRAVMWRRVMFGAAIAVGLLFGALAALVATWGMGR